MLRTIEPLAATAATIRHQPYDPHHAIQKAMRRGAAHMNPTAHRTARALPPRALRRGAFHLLSMPKAASSASSATPRPKTVAVYLPVVDLGSAPRGMTCRPERLGTRTSLAGARLSACAAYCAYFLKRTSETFGAANTPTMQRSLMSRVSASENPRFTEWRPTNRAQNGFRMPGVRLVRCGNSDFR